jgi:RNA polymerase sigma factor (sigma-70 family)
MVRGQVWRERPGAGGTHLQSPRMTTPGPRREPAACAGDCAATTLHVRQALGGDARSLAWVVARLTPLLLAQASYRLGPALRPHYDPEDLVNDAWLVALPRLPQLLAGRTRHTPVLLKFLSTTLLYRANNLLKKHLRGEPLRAPPDALDAIAANASGVVTKAVREEARSDVARRIAELEETDRAVLMLRGIEQQDVGTVAMLLGIRPEAVRMRYSRALQRLRARLPGSVFDEFDPG